MRTSYLKRLWLVTRVWVIAVVANALLGTLIISDFKYRSFSGDALLIGLVLGAIFSLPVAATLLVVIKNGIVNSVTGKQMFQRLLLTAVLCTVIVFIIFWGLAEMRSEMFLLFPCSIVSGILSVATQYRSILKCGSDYNNTQLV